MGWKNYELTGNAGGASTLAEDGIETPVEREWFTPTVARSDLKRLMRRADSPAIWNFVLWIGLMVLIAGLTIATWGSAWGIFWLIVYSTVHQSATARQHELGHGTPFRTRWLNDALFHFSSFITLSEGLYYRWRHSRHHTHTIIVGKDPEIQSPRPPRPVLLVVNIFNLSTVVASLRDLAQRASGNLGSGERFVPSPERGKVIWAARIYLLLIALIAATSLLAWSWLPVLLTIGPRVIGAPLYAFLHFTQHAGLSEDVYDHRLNSRTVLMNPVLRFLYLNMNFHMEHHMFPMVPYYRLPALHRLIRHECPPPKIGLVDAYREIVPALLRQTRDPSHFIRPTLPGTA